MGFFGFGNRGLKHEDYNKRLLALQKVGRSDQKTLYSIVKEDTHQKVRLAALQRLDDVDYLSSLREHSDSQVTKIVVERLAGVVVKQILSRPLAQAQNLLEQVTEQSALTEITLKATDKDVQAAALKKLLSLEDLSEKLLTRIAIQDADATHAQQVIPLISKLSALREVKKLAKAESIREAASVALENQGGENHEVAQAKRRRVQLWREQVDELELLAQEAAVVLEDERVQKLIAAYQLVAKEHDSIELDDDAQVLNARYEHCETVLAERSTQKKEHAQIVQKALAAGETFLEEWAAKIEDETQRAGVDRDEIEAAWKAIDGTDLEECAALRARFMALIEPLASRRPVSRKIEEATQKSEASTEENAEVAGLPEKAIAAQKVLADLLESYEADVAVADEAAIQAKEEVQQEEQAEEKAADTKQDKKKELSPQKKLSQAFRNAKKLWFDNNDAATSEQRALWKELDNSYSKIRAAEEARKEAVIEEALKGMDGILAKLTKLQVSDITSAASQDDYKEFQELRQQWRNIGRVPRARLEDRAERFDALCDSCQLKFRELFQEKDWERYSNGIKAKEIITALEALAGEELADEDRYQRLSDLQQEWKALKGLPQEKRESLWESYKVAGDAVFAKLEQFFAGRDAERSENLVKKQKLLEKLTVELDGDDHLQSVGAGDDFVAQKRRHEKIKEIQEEWKEIGHVPRENVKELQSAYRQLLDRYYQKRRVEHEARQGEQEENLKAKRELLAEVVKLAEKAEQFKDGKHPQLSESDLHYEMRGFTQQWRNIGFIPKAAMDEVQGGYQVALDRIRAVLEPWYQQRDEERGGNLAAKKEILADLEKLCEEERPDWFKDEFEAIQTKWKEAGPVPRDDAPDLNKKFYALCDKVRAAGEEAAQSAS